MVDTRDHLRKIRETKDQIKTASYPRQQDLKKYLNRLEREFAECKMYMAGGSERCQTRKTL